MPSPVEAENITDSDSDEFNLEGQEALEQILVVDPNDEFEDDDGAKYALDEDSDEFDIDSDVDADKFDDEPVHDVRDEPVHGVGDEGSTLSNNFANESPASQQGTKFDHRAETVEERPNSIGRYQLPSDHDEAGTELIPMETDTSSSSVNAVLKSSSPGQEYNRSIQMNISRENTTNPQQSGPLDLDQVRNQWANVNTIRESQGYGKDPVRGFDNIEESPIRSSDAYALLQKNPKFEEFVNIESNVEEKSLMNFISKVTLGACGNASLKKHLTREKRELLAVCKIPLDLTDSTHIRMMGTLYKKLTGEKYNCPMIGSHWEHLGFQRPNPQTDLRDAGMFGIAQLLYFLERGKDIPINLLHLSQTKGIDFPFCVVSLNMTAITKGLLRSGRLNAIINKRKSVEEAMNLAYMSIFYDFYLTWKRRDKTIYDYGSIKKELERQAEKKIEKWIARLEKNVLSSRFEGVEKINF